MRTETKFLPIIPGILEIIEAHRKALLRGTGFLLAALCAMTCGGCQTDSKPIPPDQPPGRTAVLLQAGDVIQIAFPSSPEMNQSQKIRLDGKINLPVVGEVDAAGKTLDNLQEDLERLYKPNMLNDQVVLTLESSERAVYVSGAVNKPGEIVFDRPMTVLEAVMESGGFAYVANTGSVHLIRQSGGQQRTLFLDLRSALRGKPTKAVYLQAGDILYVPEKAFNF